MIEQKLQKIFSLIKETQLEKAEIELDALLALHPNIRANRVAFTRMILASHQCRYKEAHAIGENLLRSEDATDPLVRFHQARNSIAVGEWKKGLALFDSVRGNGIFGGQFLTAEKPLWSRENLLGKVILLACEGGLGDAICFSRFATQLSQLGARVIIAGYEPLFPLLRNIPGVSAVVDLSVANKCDFDFWLPALSAPRLLDLEYKDISGKPYVECSHTFVNKWKQLTNSENIKIGLVWQGRTEFEEDYVRSIPGELFAILMDLPNVEFFKIQFESHNNSFKHTNLKDLTVHVEGPLDSAGFISQMDLIVSVDSGLAHLAGAMGKPVILLNRVMGWFAFGCSPDHEHPQKTPWYDSMLVLHQKKWGQWDETILRLKKLLTERNWIKPEPV